MVGRKGGGGEERKSREREKEEREKEERANLAAPKVRLPQATRRGCEDDSCVMLMCSPESAASAGVRGGSNVYHCKKGRGVNQ